MNLIYRLQFWILKFLPAVRDKWAAEILSLTNLVQKQEDEFSAYKAEESKRAKERKAELLNIINDSSPECSHKWIEMGLRRALLREAYIGRDTTLELAEHMLRAQSQFSADVLDRNGYAHFKDLVTSEMGREMFVQMVEQIIHTLPNWVKLRSYAESESLSTNYLMTIESYNVNLRLSRDALMMVDEKSAFLRK